MAASVKGKRAYHSPRRQQQAAATRAAILGAAETRFDQHGYVATTMDAIAAEAGVALKTVYSAFATKSGVLRALWDLRLKGDADEAPVSERPWYREMLDEPEPRCQIEMMAANARIVRSRIGRLLRTIRSAAAVDADAGALWHFIQTDFYGIQRTLVVTIADRGGLRRGLDVDRATDILSTLNHPDVWLLLVGDRGWRPEEFEAWFTETVCDQLLA